MLETSAFGPRYPWAFSLLARFRHDGLAVIMDAG